MSNEIIVEFKVEKTAAVAAIGGVRDAMVYFQESVSMTMISMRDLSTAEQALTSNTEALSTAEQALTSQTEALETAWGLSDKAMLDMNAETEKMIDVINRNSDAFAKNETKAALMKQTLKEQMDKYIQFGNEVPKELQAVADKYEVLSTSAEEAKKKQEKALEEMKDKVVKVSGTFSTFFGNLKGLGKLTGIGGGIFGVFESGTKAIGDGAEKALKMGQNFEQIGKIVGPMVNNMKTSFTGAFSSISSAGGGFFKSFAGGLSGLGTSLKGALKGGMASLKGAWKGMSTGMKLSVGLVGAELVGKGLAALADAYSAAYDRAMAKIIEQAKVEKKAFDDIRLIRDHADADLKKRMLTMREEARQRGEDYGVTSVKIQKAFDNEIKALKKKMDAEAKHKQELQDMTKTLNIMTDGAMKNLNHESDIMVEAIQNGTAAWGENRTMTDAARAAVQAQMDKYIAMGQQIPANLQAIADKHGILTSKQEEWKKKSDAMKESLGLLTREGAKALSDETALLVQNIERNKTAFENNSVAAATMRDRIQEQLDKYEGMNNVPEKLQALADEYGVVTSKQEALLSSLGILTKSGMSDLNDETSNLVDTINKNADAFSNNEAKAKLMKDEVQKQLDKYKEMGIDVPQALQDVATKYEVVDTATREAKAAADEYASSLGFVKKEDVTTELDKMTKALTDNAEQYKNNPDMIQGMLDKMAELEKQAKQAGITLPDSYNKEKKALIDVKTEVDNNAASAKKLKEEKEKLKEKIDKLTPVQKALGDLFGISDEKMVKLNETAGKLGGTLTDISGHGKEVLGFLESTGIVSGETAEALGGLLDGVGQVGAGFTELATNPIGGAMKILGGVVKTVTNIFKLFSGDGVGEAIDREREMIDISEEMEKKIRDLEDALGDTHAATSMLMGEIIAEAEINEGNFANYAQRTRDILADLDSGALSIGETQQAMGSAFNELLGDAQRLGTEGSKEMIALIGDVRSRGLEVAEMQDYVNEKLDAGVSALQSYLGTFADSGAIQEQIAALNAELASGTLTAEEAMAKQEELTLKQQELSTATADVTANWDFMQVAAMSTFHALEAQGHSFVEIVGMMQDQLSGIGQMAQANGLQVSEGLQAMTNLSSFVTQHEDLATRIDSTRVMMESLGDSAFLTGNDFAMFAEQTGLQFEQIMANTTDQEMALRLISPALEDLIKYSESYGYQIDENTQALIDQAREEGVLAKETHTDQEVTNRLLLSIAEAWGAHIPAGLKKFGEEFDASMAGVQGKTREFQDSLSDVEGQFNSNLSTAVRDFDATYTNAMTGSSIVTETNKWSSSLSGVEGQLKHDLVGSLSQVKREAEGTFSSAGGNIDIVGRTVEELRDKLQGKLPAALSAMESTANTSFSNVQRQTGAWSNSLESVRAQITGNLTKAVKDFDREYTDAMTGHSIVTETGKWKYSLEEVNDILGRELVDSADGLDDRYSHVIGNLNNYLEATSANGYKARLSFDEMVDELQVLQNAYDGLASKTDRTDTEDNILADYKRQIDELTTAIEDSAPTLDNYRKKFNELKSGLSGSIGVNTEMIGIAKGLRNQGLSTDEIDAQVSGSLSSGAKGLASWVDALGPGREQMDELARLEQKFDELENKKKKTRADREELEALNSKLNDLRTDMQAGYAEDQEAFLGSQEMMVAYFHSLQSEGKSLTEIMSIMGDSFDAVAGKTITDEMEENGFQLSDTFSQLYDLQQKMSENDSLIAGIEGLSGALHGMGDSMLYMTEDTFANFESASVSAFDKLKAAGFDQRQSLQMLAPLLTDLESYSAEYGYSLDSSTAKLLEEAKKSGLIKEEQKSDTEKLIDANTQLADIMQTMVDTFTDMGEASPFSAMQTHAEQLQKEIVKMKKELESLYDKRKQYSTQETEGYVSAALGYHGVLPRDTWFQLHRGERVDVWTPEETRKIQATPIRRMNLSDTHPSRAPKGDIVFEHITIQSENGDEAVKEFMTAIKGNKYGVQNLIRKVAN